MEEEDSSDLGAGDSPEASFEAQQVMEGRQCVGLRSGRRERNGREEVDWRRRGLRRRDGCKEVGRAKAVVILDGIRKLCTGSAEEWEAR